MSNLGHSGNGFLSYATDLTITVGLGAPNVNPTQVYDAIGQKVLTLSPNGVAGMTLSQSYIPTSRSVDNSWLSHGGLFTVQAGNKIDFKSGSGGFTVNTCGLMWLHSAAIDVYTGRVNITAQELRIGTGTLSITSGETHFRGKTTFYENIEFLNNVKINGGLFVNGESFMTHSTNIGKKCNTKPSSSFEALVNPAQSFMVYNGCSGTAKTTIKTPWKTVEGMPKEFGYIDAVIAMEIPTMSGIQQIPCKIVFPNGISMCSDTYVKAAKGPKDIIAMASSPQRIPLDDIADIDGPGHSHEYIGSGQSVDGSDSFFEAAQACSGDTPVAASPSQSTNAKEIADELIECHAKPVLDWMAGKETYARKILERFTGV